MSLTVCYLTRNEEANIGRAISSVKRVAFEILVVDTASRDRTAEVATSLGAKVVQFVWEEDFAAGRNFALSQAAGDWILWTNADEDLIEGSEAALRECMTRPGVFGYFVRLVEQVAPGGPDAETLDLRLFQRRADAQYVGRAHPHFTPEFVEAVKKEGQQILPSAVALRSYANATPRSEAKLRWTIRLLELELQDRPGQLHYMIELGRMLLHLKDPKGQEVMNQAAVQVLALRDAPRAPAMKVQMLFEHLLSIPNSPISIDEIRDLALRWFPGSPPLLYRLAETLFKRQQFREASLLLERLVHLGRTGYYDKSRRFHPGLIGEDALINLGACYRQLGEISKAEPCYRQLLGSSQYHVQAAAALAELAKNRPT